MQNIIPVSHLKNYSNVVKHVKKNKPVYLTRNGIPCYALLNLEAYEELLNCKECLIEVVGGLLEVNGLLEEEQTESGAEKSNKTTDEFYELNRGIIDENIDITAPQNSEDIQESEADKIWEVLIDILRGMSVIFDVIDRMFSDVYGFKIDSFKDQFKENKWKLK